MNSASKSSLLLFEVDCSIILNNVCITREPHQQFCLVPCPLYMKSQKTNLLKSSFSSPTVVFIFICVIWPLIMCPLWLLRNQRSICKASVSSALHSAARFCEGYWVLCCTKLAVLYCMQEGIVSNGNVGQKYRQSLAKDACVGYVFIYPPRCHSLRVQMEYEVNFRNDSITGRCKDTDEKSHNKVQRDCWLNSSHNKKLSNLSLAGLQNGRNGEFTALT